MVILGVEKSKHYGIRVSRKYAKTHTYSFNVFFCGYNGVRNYQKSVCVQCFLGHVLCIFLTYILESVFAGCWARFWVDFGLILWIVLGSVWGLQNFCARGVACPSRFQIMGWVFGLGLGTSDRSTRFLRLCSNYLYEEMLAICFTKHFPFNGGCRDAQEN